MTKYFTFNSEQEAEQFCTQGCPIYGKDLSGNEVRDRGVTIRLADWKKHPTEELWLVQYDESLADKEGEIQEFDREILFPTPKMEDLLKLKV
jgi:hypothetical protein